jgi:hypothetical protein
MSVNSLCMKTARALMGLTRYASVQACNRASPAYRNALLVLLLFLR